MARHRKECPPKHRALAPADRPGRRVPLSAAIDAARAALETAQPDAPGDEPGQYPEAASSPPAPSLHDQETIELPAALYPAPVPGDDSGDDELPGRDQRREHMARPRRPRTRLPAGGRPAPGGPPRPRMRGLLVTPWFAAGVGFVIAAALALNSPHTVLTYRPNTSKCVNCKPPAPSRGALASAQPGVVLRTPKKAAKGHPAAGSPGGVVGVQVGYRVVWRKDGEFGAIITVPASQARHGWKLRFDIPGTRITEVWGAQWQPDAGGHGGLASVPAPRPARPWAPRHPGAPGPGHRHPGHGPGRHGWPGRGGQSQPPGQPGLRDAAQLDNAAGWGSPQDVRFLVIAAGDPRTPDSCVLNAAACHFG